MIANLDISGGYLCNIWVPDERLQLSSSYKIRPLSSSVRPPSYTPFLSEKMGSMLSIGYPKKKSMAHDPRGSNIVDSRQTSRRNRGDSSSSITRKDHYDMKTPIKNANQPPILSNAIVEQAAASLTLDQFSRSADQFYGALDIVEDFKDIPKLLELGSGMIGHALDFQVSSLVLTDLTLFLIAQVEHKNNEDWSQFIHMLKFHQSIWVHDSLKLEKDNEYKKLNGLDNTPSSENRGQVTSRVTDIKIALKGYTKSDNYEILHELNPDFTPIGYSERLKAS